VSESKKFSWPTFFAVIGGIAVSQILQSVIGRDGLIGIFVFGCVGGFGYWIGRRSAFKEIDRNKQRTAPEPAPLQKIATPKKEDVPSRSNSADERINVSTNPTTEQTITCSDADGNMIEKTFTKDIVTGAFLNEDGTRMDYIDRLRAGLES
jgi:hypothetical protein